MADTQSTCVVPSCERMIKNKTLGYCDPHYKRYWRHGDVQEHIPVPKQRKAPSPVNDRDGSRQCQQCGTWNPLDSYHLDPSSPLGRKTVCAPCRRETEKARHHLHREANNARSRAYRVAHIDELRAKGAKAYEDNKALRVAQATAHTHLRRARLSATPGGQTSSLRKSFGSRSPLLMLQRQQAMTQFDQECDPPLLTGIRCSSVAMLSGRMPFLKDAKTMVTLQ